MKNGPTIFLRLALIAMGLIVLVTSALMIPAIYNDWGNEFPEYAGAKFPVMIGLSVAVIAILTAFYYAFTLLDLIDRNKSFSKLSVSTLQKIKYCAFVVAGTFTLGMPLVYLIAEKDDAPGLILIIGVIFIGAPVIIAIFAGVCQRLFQNAIDLKSENDLTV